MVSVWNLAALGGEKMSRFCWVALLAVLVSPVAMACSCGTGGDCHCGASCSCAGHSTTPKADVVALALASPQTVQVGVDNFLFSGDATIHVGDTVEWHWLNPGTHTVTSVAGTPESFDSGFQSDGSFFHTFTQAGTYNYYCQLHGFDNGDGTAGGMSAKVTVLAVPEPAFIGLGAVATLGALLRRRRTVGH